MKANFYKKGEVMPKKIEELPHAFRLLGQMSEGFRDIVDELLTLNPTSPELLEMKGKAFRHRVETLIQGDRHEIEQEKARQAE